MNLQLAQVFILASEGACEGKLHWIQLIDNETSLVYKVPNGNIVGNIVVVGVLVIDNLNNGSHHHRIVGHGELCAGQQCAGGTCAIDNIVD